MIFPQIGSKFHRKIGGQLRRGIKKRDYGGEKLLKVLVYRVFPCIKDSVYIEEGITGTSIRPARTSSTWSPDALIGKIDLIVTKSVSRFARNKVNILTTIRQLKEHGTECYFEKENIWTFDSKGELLITIMSNLDTYTTNSIESVNSSFWYILAMSKIEWITVFLSR